MQTLFFVFFCFCFIPAAVSQNSCYTDLLAAGNKHLNAGRYDKAIQQYEAAKICGDKPANGDGVLKNKIASARQKKKETAEQAAEAQQEKEAASEKERLAKEEAARKTAEQNQLAEFAWQKLQTKPSPLQYYYFAQKYPLSNRGEEARQKIAEIQARFDPEQCDYCPEMVLVEGGSFIPGDLEEHLKSGKLPPAIKVDDFYIGKFEVGISEFCQFLNEEIGPPKQIWSNGDLAIEWSHPKTRNFDANFGGMTYTDGKYAPTLEWQSGPAFFKENFWYTGNDLPEYFFLMYADWLSIKTGRNYRLPYNEEWEFAAKGGVKSQNFRYSGSNEATEVADKPHLSVKGQRQPNELGIYDMSGNVGEFTLSSPEAVKYAQGELGISNIYGARLVFCEGKGQCGIGAQKDLSKRN